MYNERRWNALLCKIPLDKLELIPLCDNIVDSYKNNLLQCTICTEIISIDDYIWECNRCYLLIHFDCAMKWSQSSAMIHQHIRCPGCNNSQIFDRQPHCFCGKSLINNDFMYLPNCCGVQCDKKLQCGHLCQLICHPGPCPPCAIKIKKNCPSGHQHIDYYCSLQPKYICNNVCGKLMNCFFSHTCQRLCHYGTCECQHTYNVLCYCQRSSDIKSCHLIRPNTILSSESYVENTVDITNLDLYQYLGYFSCKSICGKMLDCGHHSCPMICHIGPCHECQFLKYCCCGKLIEDYKRIRLSCIVQYTCGNTCNKVMNCKIHKCQRKCHPGPCICELEFTQFCRCKSTSRKYKCQDRDLQINLEFMCANKCKKLLRCGKSGHTCQEICCPFRNEKKQGRLEHAHMCLKPCDKKLGCSIHICEKFCHKGQCDPCRVMITNKKLVCPCGSLTINPPYECGKQATCNNICDKILNCGHRCSMTCHFGQCGECKLLISKYCVGNHILLMNIVCSKSQVICSNRCAKSLACGHYCISQCHFGSCPPCNLPCGSIRPDCGHFCPLKCNHKRRCENNECFVSVIRSCICGKVRGTMPCCESGQYNDENNEVAYLDCDDSCCIDITDFTLQEIINTNIMIDDIIFDESIVNWAENHTNLLGIIENTIDELLTSNKSLIIITNNIEIIQYNIRSITMFLGLYNLSIYNSGGKFMIYRSKFTKIICPSIKLSQLINKEENDQKSIDRLEPRYSKSDNKLGTQLLLYDTHISLSYLKSQLQNIISKSTTIKRLNGNNYVLNCWSPHIATDTLNLLMSRGDFKIRRWGINTDDININFYDMSGDDASDMRYLLTSTFMEVDSDTDSANTSNQCADDGRGSNNNDIDSDHIYNNIDNNDRNCDAHPDNIISEANKSAAIRGNVNNNNNNIVDEKIKVSNSKSSEAQFHNPITYNTKQSNNNKKPQLCAKSGRIKIKNINLGKSGANLSTKGNRFSSLE